MPALQGRYFIATMSYMKANFDESTNLPRDRDRWSPAIFHMNNDKVEWVKGQIEEGAGGFRHYQFIFSMNKKTTITGALKMFPDYCKPHLELTRSEAAEDYVCKDDTKVAESEFEYGVNKYWSL